MKAKTLWVIATLAVGEKCPCEELAFESCKRPPVICLKPVRDATWKTQEACESARKRIFGDDEHYQCVDIRDLFK